MKRERWTEQDLDALPAGEHDYFDRKGGDLFRDTGRLLGTLAKALSALANSGGGQILLGVRNDGTPDGVPSMRGGTTTRDWLEQKVPYLINYPLSDFRVHVVERSAPSRIPADREVIIIDVGDSAPAPHQCDHDGGGVQRHVYYHRRAGHSVPAPHFYVELLRQRLVSPVLETELIDCQAWGGMRVLNTVFVAIRARFVVRNVGRVAAHKWAVQVVQTLGHPGDLGRAYRFHRVDFPPPTVQWKVDGGTDETILPGGAAVTEWHWGVYINPPEWTTELIQAEVDRMILSVSLGYRVATETSLGDVRFTDVRPIIQPAAVEQYLKSIVQWLGS